MNGNVEWEMLGHLIAQFAKVGAKPWELRLLALKGGRVSMRDVARMAARHGCNAQFGRLTPKEGR